MDLKMHVAAGAAAFLLLAAAGLEPSPALLAATIFGAILPDADHQNTKLYSAIAGALAGLAGAVAFQAVEKMQTANALVAAALAGTAVALLLPLIKPRHRGFMHSVVFGATYASLVALIAWKTGTDWKISIGAAAGFATHLMLDNEWKIK